MSRRAIIVATLASEPTEELIRSVVGVSDVLEIRADLIGDPDPDWLRSVYPGELLYTLRSVAEGGAFGGSTEDRQRRLCAADSYDLVDLEAARDLTTSVLSAVSESRRIVSWHGPSEPSGALVTRATGMMATGARWYKLVPEATDVAEAVAPLATMRRLPSDRLVCFASGVAGSWTRLLAPRLGAAVVFAAVGDRPGAPGQLSIERLRGDYGLPGLPHVDKLFGVVGNPVEQSLSPRLHNGLYRHLGVPSLYLPFHVARFGSFWLEVVEAGYLDSLGPRLEGLSVTTPHKEIALAVAGASSPLAGRVGAANTLVQRRGVWEAETSDPEGVIHSLEAHGEQVAGRRAAVFGVGGAGRSAAIALDLAGAMVTLVNRTPGRGQHEAERLRLPFLPWADLDPAQFDILVNATPLGRLPTDEQPFEVESLPPGGVVVDMVYLHDEETALTSAARTYGLTVVDGREVLLHQAGRQFHMMTDLDFPLEEARRLLELGPPA